jgi:tetratricopeptide (TPR) repeat protein
MLDAQKILQLQSSYEPAHEILAKAQHILINDIRKAKALPDRSNEIDYIELITRGQEIGRDEQDYPRVITMFKRALEIYPEGDLGRWGLATAYMQEKEYDKSITEYREIIRRNPLQHRYRFELGQVMICKGDILGGLKQIHRVMEKTEEFDSFLYVMGDLLVKRNKLQEALQTYELYLEKFPGDYSVWKKLERLGEQMEEHVISTHAHNMYESLKPKEK